MILSLLRALSGSDRDGAWYLSWSTCEVVVTKDKSNSHSRWQVRLDQGPNSVGVKLKVALDDPVAWARLWSITDYLKIQ